MLVCLVSEYTSINDAAALFTLTTLITLLTMRPLSVINSRIAAEKEILLLQQSHLVGLGFFRDRLQEMNALRDKLLPSLEATIANPTLPGWLRADALAKKDVEHTRRADDLQRLAQNELNIARTQQAVTRTTRNITELQTELALR